MPKPLRDLFPATYQPFLPPLFDAPEVVETRATCSDCAMCDRSDTPEDVRAEFFRPDIKCCTYYPTLPNYLVGAILDDPRPEARAGAERVRGVIAKGIGVLPTWLAAPRKHRLLLNAARESSFGRSEALLCPYYEKEGGLCSIWHHRESVCATFFCKHDAGGSGRAFWMALKQWFGHVERAVATHVARALVPEMREPDMSLGKLTREELEDRAPAAQEHAAAWGSWAGREAAFYVECHRRVSGMARDAFDEIVGARAGELLATTEKLYGAVTAPKLARFLRLNPEMPTTRGKGGVAVTPYSRYDSFVLPDELYDVLAKFGPGEDVEGTIARLKREEDVELPREVLLEMQVFEVMTPVEGDARDSAP